MPASTTTARAAALQALQRIDEGAFVNLELQSWFRRCPHWEAQDRSLFTELLYGTVRWQYYLDHFLARWSSQALDHLEKPVLAALRLGLYQIRFLNGIPDHAAVAETCEVLKQVLPRAVGYANAVLRKATRETAWVVQAPKESVLWLAISYSHPEWLVQRWLKRWGYAETEQMLTDNNNAPLLWLRENRIKKAEHSQDILHAEGVRTVSGLPEAYGLEGVALRTIQPDIDNGSLTVQDLSAMLMAHILAPKPGQKVLDLCAAPGGKSCQMAELMEDQGRVVAIDLHPHRVELIQAQAKRLNLSIVEAVCHDAQKPWREGEFDRVLLDAPCSGTGVLRRKVDARWSKSPEQLVELQKLQRSLLHTARKAMKPGGYMLYSTCSLEAEENEANIRWLLGQYPELKLTPFEHPALTHVEGPSLGYMTVTSRWNESDGFFMALFQLPSDES